MQTTTCDLDWTPGPVRVDYWLECSEDGRSTWVIIGNVRQVSTGRAVYPNEEQLTDLKERCLEREREEAEARHRARHDVVRRKEGDQYAE